MFCGMFAMAVVQPSTHTSITAWAQDQAAWDIRKHKHLLRDSCILKTHKWQVLESCHHSKLLPLLPHPAFLTFALPFSLMNFIVHILLNFIACCLQLCVILVDSKKKIFLDFVLVDQHGYCNFYVPLCTFDCLKACWFQWNLMCIMTCIGSLIKSNTDWKAIHMVRKLADTCK